MKVDKPEYPTDKPDLASSLIKAHLKPKKKMKPMFKPKEKQGY